MIDIRVPKVGMSAAEVEIVTIHVGVGDRVRVGDPVVELGADKVDFTVEAEADSVVTEVLVAEGDVCEVGSVLMRLDTEAAG